MRKFYRPTYQVALMSGKNLNLLKEMKRKTDVVIVGGCIMGTSIAYNLADLGNQKIQLKGVIE